MTKSMKDNLVSIKAFVLKLEPKKEDEPNSTKSPKSTHLPQAQ
jgi:hypothetical protein